jgi:carbon starvation protein CstA
MSCPNCGYDKTEQNDIIKVIIGFTVFVAIIIAVWINKHWFEIGVISLISGSILIGFWYYRRTKRIEFSRNDIIYISAGVFLIIIGLKIVVPIIWNALFPSYDPFKQQ